MRELWLRTGLPVSMLERLADADAFGSLGLTRRQALWAVKALGRAGDQDDLPLFAAAERRALAAETTSPVPAPGPGFSEPAVALPAMPLGEEVINDYRFLRLSLRAHPAAFLRTQLAARRILENDKLRSLRCGTFVRVSGLVTIRQRPGSAQGVIFLTIEDETSIANIIVWPKVFERFRPIIMGARYIAVCGRMQEESGVIHVVAERLDDLTHLLGLLNTDLPPHPTRSTLAAETAATAAHLDTRARGSAHAPTRKAAAK